MNVPVLSGPLGALAAQGQVPVPDSQLGTGETVLFWVVAPVLVLAASGLLFVRKAVHAALLVALVMIGLAVLYTAQEAHFLGVAQVVVYTGAVMMLFLFVLMLVGVDSSDSLVETIRGQRLIGALAGLGLALLLVAMVTGLTRDVFGVRELQFPVPVGLAQANADGNPTGVARILFSDFVFAFELTGALLIIAALSAIILTHRERLAPRSTQRSLATRRIRENVNVAGLPAPGVFARHNSVDTPALLPDGTPSELSVSRVLRARGQERSAVGLGSAVRDVTEDLEGRSPRGVQVGDRLSRGITGTQLPDDQLVDGTNRSVEPHADDTGRPHAGSPAEQRAPEGEDR